MSSPHLSICIATLNRAAYLGATLESLIAQAPDEVEIVIVDGASTDNTEEVVRRFQRDFPRLTYLRLPAKGGVDQDYCRAVDLARGEYVWLFTDDDLIKPGAVAAVLQASREGHSLIVVNAEVRDPDLRRVLARSRLPFRADRVYNPAPAEQDRLLAEVGDYLSFIGGVVVQRALWAAREKARYWGSEFVHVGVLFQAPLPGTALVLAEPWIQIRYGNAQWTSRFFEVWMFKWPQLIWSLEQRATAARRRVTPPEPWRSLWALFLFRARGAFSESDYQRLIAPRLRSPFQRGLARLMAHLPGCLANGLASVYAWARRYHLLAVDLRNSPFAIQSCWRRS